MNKFEKFDKPIKDYDGFIDRDGYFYKVKKTDSKEADGHYNWAVAYINTFLDNVSNNLLDIRELIKKSDPVEYLINYLGFIYYSHNPEYGTPLVQGPNPRYGGKKLQENN